MAVAGLLAAGLTAAVTTLEETDAFCAACHTAPEVEYVARSRAARAGGYRRDLSSAHYPLAGADFKCIDCHRGDGRLVHRLRTMALGGRDFVIHLFGEADPTVEKAAADATFLLNAACARCHAAALLVLGFANHYHNRLPEAYAAWRAGGALTALAESPEVGAVELRPYATTVSCHDCHQAHVTVEGGALAAYLDQSNVVYPACERCHQEIGEGPLDLAGP